MVDLPTRYDIVSSLGRGGGGEVWRVQDRLTGRELALKVLADDAREGELQALVREASALSGLIGLGLPVIEAFGVLPNGRRYLVRELVVGRSLSQVLEEPNGAPWLLPFACACAQTASIHRAGFFHGDLKPANIIVTGPSGATLVDLGLIAPWRDGESVVRGLTPAFAAPELLSGAPLSVRTEVYALGITLREALVARGGELADEVRSRLRSGVVNRALESNPSLRFPSVAEFESALRSSAGLPAGEESVEPVWPIVGPSTVDALVRAVHELLARSVLCLDGPVGSGRTSLLRRLSWSLGVGGMPLLRVEPRECTNAEALLLEIRAARDDGRSLLLVDDVRALDPSCLAELRKSVREGARAVVAGGEADAQLLGARVVRFQVPKLEEADASSLVRGAIASLSPEVVKDVVARSDLRPGALRTLVREIAAHTVVSSADLQDLIEGSPELSARFSASRAPSSRESARVPPPSHEPPAATIERAYLMGRIAEADALVKKEREKTAAETDPRLGVLAARIALAQGDLERASRELAAIRPLAEASEHRRGFMVAWARVLLRQGEYVEARRLALSACDVPDLLSADALSVAGVAWAYSRDDEQAQATLKQALARAEACGDDRALAIAYGSLAISDVYVDRNASARENYERSLEAASRARDAATVATTHLNMAGILRREGDLAAALVHLEAAADMARRAGVAATLQQTLLNQANLDLYLGRYARANASLVALESEGWQVSAAGQAQLLSLKAELAARTGEFVRGAALYEQASRAWLALGRKIEATESALEGLLSRAADVAVLPEELKRGWADVERNHGTGGFAEHAALAALVRATVALVCGEPEKARAAFDEAVSLSREKGRSEWLWQALGGRFRCLRGEGATMLARKDAEAAIELLEATAARLPRDLREVFWDDPRRKALRAAWRAETSAHATLAAGATVFSVPQPEERLARVLEMTRELAREHDLARLLERITDHAIALLGAERGFVLLADDAGELRAEAARDRRGDDPHARFSHSVTAKVIETGEPVVTISARDDSRLAAAVSVHQLLIQSIACVPIQSVTDRSGARTTLGALYVETRLRAGSRFADELSTLSAFADQAAIAIENTRLIAENRKRADDLAKSNAELAAARDELRALLGKKTEQLAVTRKSLARARADLGGHFGYGPFIGTSEPMRRMYATIDRVKSTDVPVLVTGESGTGKELVARAIHDGGGRSKGPFVAVNCGAIPANLLESELFGAVRGAYTGADKTRLGLVREADGGTLLLDEIGELPLPMQAGLLRVLQEMTVRPVGGDSDIRVDIRVVASTHRDLNEMVRSGKFREDLFYRLHVVEIRVPPLRDRAEDIAPLVAHFVGIFSARYRSERKTVSRDALRRLAAFSWPGNVRQLEHVLLSAWLMAESGEIEAGDFDLPESGPPPPSSTRRAASVSKARAGTVSEQKAVLREQILDALATSSWNRARAAEILGVPRRTFYRRLKEFGILP